VAGFLAAHDELYRTSIERASVMAREAGLARWLDGFLRRPGTSYVVAVNLLFGSGSFGGMRVPAAAAGAAPPTADPRAENSYVILGTPDVDPGGLPAFPSTRAVVIAHEFAHAFVSPIVQVHHALG